MDLSRSENRMKNKWEKVGAALEVIKPFLPAYVMIVDADDVVSNNISEFCFRNPNKNGWIFDKGYIYDEGSKLIYLRRNAFYKICGTSSIVHLSHNDLTEGTGGGGDKCIILKYGHTAIVEAMKSRGTPLQPLPFIGSIYILGTGENDSGASLYSMKSIKEILKKIISYRVLALTVRNQFYLRKLPVSE